MPVKLNATGGGSVSIDPPATTSNFTATMPAATGTVVLDSAAQTLTNKSWSSPAGSTVSSGTAVASTSGTSIDFTGIPSWVKRITVMFNGVSLSGTSFNLAQLGVSGTPQTTGYAGSYEDYSSTPGVSAISQAGFPYATGANNTYLTRGSFTLSAVGSNVWVISSLISSNPGRFAMCSGAVTLSGTLDMIRLTTVNGTDTFDAGTINILYE